MTTTTSSTMPPSAGPAVVDPEWFHPGAAVVPSLALASSVAPRRDSVRGEWGKHSSSYDFP